MARWWLAALALGAALPRGLPQELVELEHLAESVDRLFVVDDAVRAAEAEIDGLRAKLPAGKPMAAVTFLLKDLHCGPTCFFDTQKFGMGDLNCTFMVQAKAAVETLLAQNSMGKYKYPIVFYHYDWTAADRAELDHVVHGRVPTFWCKVTFDGQALPPALYDLEATLAPWRKIHPGGNLTRRPADTHGIGYSYMCRMYSGIIFHAPLLRKFDFYLRIDGDSRLTVTAKDPFRDMQDGGFKYGSMGTRYFEAVRRMPVVFTAALNEITGSDDRTQLPQGVAASMLCNRPDRFNCPNVHNNNVQSLKCNLRCGARGGTCDLQGKKGVCPTFYNNFEVVDMRAFRNKAHWRLFLAAERANVFFCREKACGEIPLGDAMFRAYGVKLLLSPKEVRFFTAWGKGQLRYQHPASWKQPCAATKP